MANKVYAYSLELAPTLFSVRLRNLANSFTITTDIDYVITLFNGITHSRTTTNGIIPISWYNAFSVEIIPSECFKGITVFLLSPDLLLSQFIDVVLELNECVSDDNVNQGNYFIWNSLGGILLDDLDLIPCSKKTKECYGADISNQGIINPYIKNKATKHFPIITPYNETTFYINFDVPIDSGVTNDFELGVIDEFSNLVISSIGTLEQHIVNINNDYIYFATDIQPQESELIDCNLYKFLIYDKTTNETLFVSNSWKFMVTNINDKTTYLEYRNSVTTYNFDYEGLPSFENKVRLKLYSVGYNSETEIEPYRSDSSGEVRNLESTLDKFFIVETYWFDELAHIATFVMNQHDEIKMNGIEYTIKTAHQVEDNIKSILTKGTFEVFETQFSKINKFCD